MSGKCTKMIESTRKWIELISWLYINFELNLKRRESVTETLWKVGFINENSKKCIRTKINFSVILYLKQNKYDRSQSLPSATCSRARFSKHSTISIDVRSKRRLKIILDSLGKCAWMSVCSECPMTCLASNLTWNQREHDHSASKRTPTDKDLILWFQQDR